MYLLEYNLREKLWRPSDPEIKGRMKLYLDPDQIVATDRMYFGPLSLPVFPHPQRFLDRYYGSTWRTTSSKTPKKEVVQDFRPALPTL
jgi:hypothetical protein